MKGEARPHWPGLAVVAALALGAWLGWSWHVHGEEGAAQPAVQRPASAAAPAAAPAADALKPFDAVPEVAGVEERPASAAQAGAPRSMARYPRHSGR